MFVETPGRFVVYRSSSFYIKTGRFIENQSMQWVCAVEDPNRFVENTVGSLKTQYATEHIGRFIED